MLLLPVCPLTPHQISYIAMARRKKRAAPVTGSATPEVNRKRNQGEMRFAYQWHHVDREMKRINTEVLEIGEAVSGLALGVMNTFLTLTIVFR